MITVETIQQVAHQGPFFQIGSHWALLFTGMVPQSKIWGSHSLGLYSVPAFHNEWYSRNMYIKGHPEYDHHIETYGPQKLWLQRLYSDVYRR